VREVSNRKVSKEFAAENTSEHLGGSSGIEITQKQSYYVSGLIESSISSESGSGSNPNPGF
jgi:hypothetical protein